MSSRGIWRLNGGRHGLLDGSTTKWLAEAMLDMGGAIPIIFSLGVVEGAKLICVERCICSSSLDSLLRIPIKDAAYRWLAVLKAHMRTPETRLHDSISKA